MDPGIEDQHLPEHAPVFSADGRVLGELGEIRSGHVRVQATGEPDVWLPLHAVRVASDDRVLLSFNADQLDEYREPGPPP